MNTMAKIGSAEAIALVCIGILNHTILYLHKSIFDVCNSSILLNIIYVSLLCLVFGIIIANLFKKFPDKDIVDISEVVGGKPLKYVTGILYILFFLLVCSLLLRNFSEGIKVTYFLRSPVWIIVLAFLLIPFLANIFGPSSIVRCNFIIFPLMIISFIITFIAIGNNYTFQRIFPILGKGISETFLIGSSNIFVLSGICILFFLPPMLKNKKNFKYVTLVSISISGLLLIFSIASLLFALPFIFNISELSPIYLLVRSTNFGEFLENPESVFILIWILSFMSFLSVFTMLIIYILKKFTKHYNPYIYSFAVTVIIFILTMISKTYAILNTIESTLYKYFSIFLVFVYSLIILIIGATKKKTTEVKEDD